MARSQPREGGPRRVRGSVTLRSSSARNASRLSARGRFAGVRKTRTVVKARYTSLRTKSGAVSKRGLSRIRAAANYMAYRPNEHGVREYRDAFTNDAVLTKAELNDFLEQPTGTLAYRMVLSPGFDMDEDSITEWTRDTLERAGITEYVGFAHAGAGAHTPYPHVHVIAYTDALLDRYAFAELRVIADDQALCQKVYDVMDDAKDLVQNVVEYEYQDLDV
jgi:hypothetical protein